MNLSAAYAQIDLGDAQAMAKGHIEDGKITLNWNLPRLLLPKNRVKLLLNLITPTAGRLWIAGREVQTSGWRGAADIIPTQAVAP